MGAIVAEHFGEDGFPDSAAAPVALLTLGELYLKDYVAQPSASSHLAVATAKLNQSYTSIRAPESGWVTEKSVEAGQYVQAGQSLFALVPKEVWVTANYKEDQIRRMRPGQTVEIAVDELCTSREVRLRSQDSDYSRPVDRAARRALTVYGGALQSSLAVALRLSRGSLGVRWWWLGTFGKPRRCLPTMPRDAPAPPGAGREAVAGVAPAK